MSDNARLFKCELETDHNTQDYVHYSLRKVRGFCNISQNVLYVQGCKQRPMDRPYPKRLESLTVCRCHYKGSTFSSVISYLEGLVRPQFERAVYRSEKRCLSNSANRAAVHKGTV